MDMTGERRIEASRGTVWQALNDPGVLKASIPGCESIITDRRESTPGVSPLKGANS